MLKKLFAQEEQEAAETSEIKVIGRFEGRTHRWYELHSTGFTKKVYDGQPLGVHWEGFTGLEGELNREFFAE